jgi:adenylate cyclase
MPGLTAAEAADQAGVDTAYVQELVGAGILHPADGGFSPGDVRRIGIVRTLREAGLPLEALVKGLRTGLLGLDFVDGPEYDRFPTLTRETFQEVSDRTGVPLSLLGVLRETVGFGAVRPEDRIRSDELRVVPFLEFQVRMGFDPVAIERLLRAIGDSTHRIAEAEAEWWRSQVSIPRLAKGQRGNDVAAAESSTDLNRFSQEAMLAIWNAQQAQSWTSNIISGFEYLLAKEGIYQAPERPPAICFLDITGYTRLTQEHGDRAAADLAESLARLVKRTSGDHGGRPVKWLGDGVMFYFREPGPGVEAALAMVDGIAGAGLPPAHVGLHAGPVVMQEGDYYGQTVNMAARIADYARPSEVLVSEAVVEAAQATPGITFSAIGPVELKGVSGTVSLHAARRP